MILGVDFLLIESFDCKAVNEIWGKGLFDPDK